MKSVAQTMRRYAPFPGGRPFGLEKAAAFFEMTRPVSVLEMIRRSDALPSQVNFHQEVLTPAGTALGGWVDLTIRSDGNYTFAGHMHDSGFDPYSFRVRVVVQTPAGVAIALQHLEGTPPPPTRVNPRLPGTLNGVLLRALARDPSQRYATAMQLADAVAAAAQRSAAPPVAAPPPSVPARPARMDPLGATMAMPVMRAGGGAGALAMSPPAEPTVFRAPVQRRERRSAWTGVLVAVLGLAFVFLAFLAGAQALRSMPALPSIVPPSPPVGRSILSGGGASAPAAAGSATATPTGTPTPRTTETPSTSATVSATADANETPTVSPTPAPTDTTGPPTPTPPPTWTPVPRVVAPTSTLSPPPGQVAVPAVVGMTEQDAQQTIKNAGLTTTYPNYQAFTTQPVGHVLSQQPPAGSYVSRGTTVFIAVRR